MSTHKVVVVGGGIGGLTAAVAMQRAGMDVTVFERAPDLKRVQVGGGIHLWHNAMRAYQEIGLADAVAAVGSELKRSEFRNWKGDLLASWPVDELAKELGAPTIGVSRADIHPVLVDAATPGSLNLGAQCTGFEQDAGGVTVRFADGREERCDALIGADGLRSTVRTQILGEAKPRFAGYSVWQGIIDFDHEAAPPGIFQVRWGPGSRFAWYHVGGERLYWFAVANTQEGEQEPPEGKKARLLERFASWPGPCVAMIEATDEKGISRLDMADREPVKKWTDGRVTLLGDAAHAMTFNVGQGACQAVEDGIVLAKCMKDQPDLPAALKTYEGRRVERTAEIQTLAWNIGVGGKWSNPAAITFRDMLMKMILGGPALKKHEEDMRYQF